MLTPWAFQCSSGKGLALHGDLRTSDIFQETLFPGTSSLKNFQEKPLPAYQ